MPHGVQHAHERNGDPRTFNRYETMLSACSLSNNKRQHSYRAHVVAKSNHRISQDPPSDHAAEIVELRHLLRDARESIYHLTRRDSPPPTDTTPKPPGIAQPRYAAAYQAAPPPLAVIKNQAATTPDQHWVPFLHRKLGDDQRKKRNNRDEACPSGTTPPLPYPAPTAIRREISSFIRANRICFATPLVFHMCRPLIARTTTSYFRKGTIRTFPGSADQVGLMRRPPGQ